MSNNSFIIELLYSNFQNIQNLNFNSNFLKFIIKNPNLYEKFLNIKSINFENVFINGNNFGSKYNILFYSIIYGYDEFIYFLDKIGFNFNILNNEGNLFHNLIYKKNKINFNLFEFFIKKGVNINQKNQNIYYLIF